VISLFEFFAKNTITVITPLKVNRNVSISLHVWLVRTRARDQTYLELFLRQTSVSSGEFLKIQYEQVKTVKNNSYEKKHNMKTSTIYPFIYLFIQETIPDLFFILFFVEVMNN